ncbi:LPXTG cell wall anchor domain-containing protein [Amycolatopsis sp. MtRt-6]|uniref:LPXTG cell wall anchor domain-containing protein n=1 Tax=Amycolatopsis sp. MtRt-6 TaxID=2792782 RepID=UPI001F5E0CFB|nr:LPXTG cell wall anchor domain-containing protein [Amycolatopsis sp. MtRt-6]
MKQNGNKHSITFTGVQPGVWYATMSCLEGGTGSWWRKFTVGEPGTPTPTKPTPTKPTPKPTKPKPAPQVAVKPQGAPQTGGGPAENESTAPALVAAGAILLVGAGGAVVLRRRASARR